VWRTGLLQRIACNPAGFAASLASRITPQDKADWQTESIEDWVTDGQQLAQTA